MASPSFQRCQALHLTHRYGPQRAAAHSAIPFLPIEGGAPCHPPLFQSFWSFSSASPSLSIFGYSDRPVEGGITMNPAVKPCKAETVEAGLTAAEPQACLMTTLYDVMAALHTIVERDEDNLVADKEPLPTGPFPVGRLG